MHRTPSRLLKSTGGTPGILPEGSSSIPVAIDRRQAAKFQRRTVNEEL